MANGIPNAFPNPTLTGDTFAPAWARAASATCPAVENAQRAVCLTAAKGLREGRSRLAQLFNENRQRLVVRSVCTVPSGDAQRIRSGGECC